MIGCCSPPRKGWGIKRTRPHPIFFRGRPPPRQDPHESSEILPYTAAYARLMKARNPNSHPEESINTLVRAGELSGGLYNPWRRWPLRSIILDAARRGAVMGQAGDSKSRACRRVTARQSDRGA
jgi:hypothetical protein